MSSAGRMRPLCPHGRSGRYAISRCAAPPRWAAIWNDVTSVATSVTHITRAGDRTCPKCQSLARAKWLEKRRAELLPVEYFHVVFTLPEPLAQLSLQNQRQMYDLLFRATAETLQTIAADPQHLGAQIGFFCILHSWGQSLTHHPHLHCVVPGGGISLDGSRWIGCKKSSFFLPVRLLSQRFRKAFLRSLRHAFGNGTLHFHGQLKPLSDPATFEALCHPAAELDGVVHVKPPFGGPRRVLKYLARYTHRVAISNHRLRSLENGHVSFEWKDYTHRSRTQLMTLDAVEFLRRFLLHVLPTGLVRIRQFGFLSNCHRAHKLQLCRALLAIRFPARCNPAGAPSLDPQTCPRCQLGHLILIELISAVPPAFADTS